MTSASRASGIVAGQRGGRGHGEGPEVLEMPEVTRRVGRAPRQREVEGRAEGEEIGPRVERLPRRTTFRGRRERHARAPGSTSLSPIGARALKSISFASAVAGAPDVGRAHVAVDEMARVDESESRSWTPRRSRACCRRHGQGCASAEVAPVEELHRVIGARRVDAVVVDLDDARVRELRQRLELALEQGDHPRLRRDGSPVCGELLSSATALAAAGVGHAVDRRHSAASEERVDPVARPELRRRGVRGVVSGRGTFVQDRWNSQPLTIPFLPGSPLCLRGHADRGPR